ncbi:MULTISPECIES: Coenzyme F420 hydrogenase/dehydrogenase, beta subunit C-terminal domain [unclassified Pseudarthrobacter]|uniref:Coenzyme F420 hydrogenase/dehydrogenase, beta subunit C-terminal domain n=1 Tax=unclassified Pseudarthrobacter TaxID=2647000 RepID=UPI0030770D1A
MNRTSSLLKEAAKVVSNGNCTGCGACALISSRVNMVLDAHGYMRPSIEESTNPAYDRQEAETFRASCPGVSVRARRRQGASYHETFGTYISAWQGAARDEKTRLNGSSGGVLTALAGWLLESGQISYAIGSNAEPDAPRRTIPVRITTKAEALAAAGSRYAPVSNLTELSDEPDTRTAAILKPCEATALAQYQDACAVPDANRPISLSFFCAGTPSQLATDRLIDEMGIDPLQLQSLRYRGNGWPGEFTAVGTSGEARSISYDESWGKHLGRELQWRCKICPDGTGEHSDISVGDYWHSDERGYPIFENASGNSAVIARTARGHQLLIEAVEAGVLDLSPVDLDSVSEIQPLQRNRRRTIVVRQWARLLSGSRVPSYRGYSFLVTAIKYPRLSLKTFLGTFLRSVRSKKINGA